MAQIPPPSDEQLQVIRSIGKNNVIVDSVAGSGKTTCILYIAKMRDFKNILIITYNARLKLETRKRVSELSIFNVDVHSYHSFCVKYYDSKCYTDAKLKSVLDSRPPAKFEYDLVIIDEAQDMTPLYYRLLCKIYSEINDYPPICIIGDRLQSIYRFNEADNRFITMSDKIFNFNALDWCRLRLSVSFRLTYETAAFVNYILADNRISVIRSGPLPLYYNGNLFSNGHEELIDLVTKLPPEEVFIICPSLRGRNSPPVLFENNLKQNPRTTHIPIYVSITSTDTLDDELIAGKLVFSTFHQVKGLERKYVFVFGFDAKYFQYHCRNACQSICPNEIYVAVTVTRASERLFLISSNTAAPFEFINPSKLPKLCEVQGEIESTNRYRSVKMRKISSESLLRHLREYAITNAYRLMNYKTCQNPAIPINITTRIKTPNGCVESVQDINRRAIIYATEMQFKKSHTLVRNALKIGNLLLKHEYGYNNKLYQILKYDWISQDVFDGIIDRIMEINFNIPEFQVSCEILDEKYILTSIIDCVDGDMAYHFICENDVKPIHLLRCAVNMYASRSAHGTLYNILTGKKYIIEANNIHQIWRILLAAKLVTNDNDISDDEFLQVADNGWIEVAKLLVTL